MAYKKVRRSYTISSDQRKLNLNFICAELSKLYWAKDLSKAIIKKSIKNSMSYGLYHQDIQIGFAKVLTDEARFAYLSDVFIIEDYRGKGLGKFLVKSIMEDPALKNVSKWLLSTTDSHGLYAKLGFEKLNNPERFMQLKKH